MDKIRARVARCADRWCNFAKKDSLYLLTAVYKSRSWTLGSFYDGSKDDEILVYRSGDNTSNSEYKWKYQSNVDDQQGPKNNPYLNQAVLVKGFKMTVRWRLHIVERVERPEWLFICILASLWSAVSWQWLNRIRECCSLIMCGLSMQIVHRHRKRPDSTFLPGLRCYSHYCMCKTQRFFSLFTLWT